MRPRHRRIAALLLILGLATAGATLGTTAATADDSAVNTLGGCMVSRKAGDVLLLMDQSASLQKTDPDDVRIDSAVYFAESLAGFAERNGVDLSIAVAGFDVNFNARSGWESVADGNAGNVAQALEDMRGQDSGFETDYWTALEGGRQLLRDRVVDQGSGGAEGAPCQAIVWFSDGQFELDKRDSASERQNYGITKPYAPGVELTTDENARQAELLGREALCQAGGLADQLRQSQQVILAIGLQSDSGTQDFSFMESIAAGTSASGEKCGDVQRADIGSFTPASSIDELLFIIDSLDPGGTKVTDRPLCSASGCPEGRHVVVLDNSIGSVRILAGSDQPQAVIEVQPPDAESPVVMEPGVPGEQDTGGARVTWRWVTDTAAEISIVPTSDQASGWSGVWSVSFVDPSAPEDAVTRTNVHVEGDLLPALTNESAIQWRVGEPLDLAFGIVRRGSGEPVDPSTLQSVVALSSTLQRGDKALDVLSDAAPAEFAEPTAVDLTEVEPGPAVLLMTLDVTTAPATGPDGAQYEGTTLDPQTVELPLTLLPPADYPVIANFVDFGTTDGTELKGELPVKGPGCVWVDTGATTTSGSPTGVGDAQITTPSANTQESCLQLAEGQESEIELSLSVGAAGNGALTGGLRALSTPLDAPDEVREQAVGFLADLRKPVDGVERGIWAGLLMFIGTVVPIMIMWAVAAWQARIPGPPVLTAIIPARLEGNTLQRRGTAGPLRLTATDLLHTDVPDNGTKRLQIPESEVTLKATGKNPFDPHVTVIAPGREVRTSYGGRRLPLAIKNRWVLMQDEAGGLALLFILPVTVADEKRDEFVAQASRAAAEKAGELPQREQPTTDPDPWAGAGSFPSSDPMGTSWSANPPREGGGRPPGGNDWGSSGGGGAHPQDPEPKW